MHSSTPTMNFSYLVVDGCCKDLSFELSLVSNLGQDALPSVTVCLIIWHCKKKKKGQFVYLSNGLLHLCVAEGGECRFQIVHNALKAVTLNYLPLMAAQQTEGHFKNHLRPLDKHKI